MDVFFSLRVINIHKPSKACHTDRRYCYGCGVAVDLVLNLFAVEYINLTAS